MLRTSASRTKGCTVLYCTVLLLLFFPKFYLNLPGHSDASIRLGQNLLFDQLLQGTITNSVLPHGTWAFLQYPLDIGLNYFLAIGFYLLINLGLLWRLKSKPFWLQAALFILIQFTVGLRFLPLALVFLIAYRPHYKYDLLLLSLLLGLYLNIRLAVGAILLVLTLIILISDRDSIKRLKSRPTLLMAASILLLVMVWAPYHFNPFEWYQHQASIFQSASYSLKPNLSIVSQLGPLLLLSICLLLFAYHKLERRAFWLISTCFLLVSAYVYSRPDPGTVYVAYNFLWPLALVLLLKTQRKDWRLVLTLPILILGLLVYEHFFLKHSFKISRFDPLYAWTTLFEAGKGLDQSFLQDRQEEYSVFPFQIQKLSQWKNARPKLRPEYISYAALSPGLDSSNAGNLEAKLIVHPANSNASSFTHNDINNYYLPFSNAFTVAYIISNYRLKLKNEQFCEYQRRGEEQSPIAYRAFSLEELKGGIARADFHAADTLVLLQSASLAQKDLMVEMKLNNGHKIQKSVSARSLHKGIFVDYFIPAANYHDSRLKIEALRVIE